MITSVETGSRLIDVPRRPVQCLSCGARDTVPGVMPVCACGGTYVTLVWSALHGQFMFRERVA